MAVGTKPADHTVAIGVAAAAEAVLNPPGQPAMRLRGKVLQEQRVHRPLEADMQFADLVFGLGHETDAGKADALIQRRHILLIARQAIERLGNHHVECAVPGAVHHGLVAGPAQRRTALLRVAIDLHNLPSLPAGKLAAHPHLVVDRRLPLHVGGVARVNDRADARTGVLAWQWRLMLVSFRLCHLEPLNAV